MGPVLGGGCLMRASLLRHFTEFLRKVQTVIPQSSHSAQTVQPPIGVGEVPQDCYVPVHFYTV